ncbi:MAG: hypothetical protein JWM34_4637 [Ilumatobacteraceae bacterium]|nr:hypothetical protein [Ilumatobacteraceae bacterium]
MTVKHMNKTVRIAEMVRTEPVIRDTVFINCAIIGPAMLFNVAARYVNSKMSHVGGTQADLFIEIEQDRTFFGAIRLEEVVFDQCRFEGIGWIMTREEIDKVAITD